MLWLAGQARLRSATSSDPSPCAARSEIATSRLHVGRHGPDVPADGRHASSESYFEEAIAIHREMVITGMRPRLSRTSVFSGTSAATARRRSSSTSRRSRSSGGKAIGTVSESASPIRRWCCERWAGARTWRLCTIGPSRSHARWGSPGEGVDLSHIAVLTGDKGQREEAIALHREALAIHRETGNRRFQEAALTSIANLLRSTGNTRRPSRCSKRLGLRIRRERIACWKGSVSARSAPRFS